MKKRIIALPIIISLLLLSCGEVPAEERVEKTDTVPEVIAPAETGESVETEPARRTLQDTVPELDFDGLDFRVLSQGSGELYREEITGDVLNDAIYNRNQAIQNRFNVNIGMPTSMDHSELATQVRRIVRSGEDAYELVLGQMEESGKNAIEGNFQNWYDIPYMDFTKPWYPKSIMQEGITTINGRMFIAESDLNLGYAGQTWVFVYDKVQADNYGIAGVYETVRDGKWTIDKLIDWTGDIYNDVDGNGIRENTDFYGLIYRGSGCCLTAHVYGMGVRTTEIQEGEIVFPLNSDKGSAVFEKIQGIFKNPGTLRYDDLMEGELFCTGCAIFANMRLGLCYSALRDYENAYGIIPLPKWDEAQEEYYTIADAGCNILAVPITTSNTELTGAITEALSAESWRSVMPTYCDICLGTKSARDPESQEMIQVALESRYIDFAYLYDGWTGWTFKLDAFIQKEGAFASIFKTNERMVRKYYEKVAAKFYE